MSITDQIFAEPEGGTVKLGGGQLPDHGYFVGGIVRPLVIEQGDRLDDVRDNIKFFIENLAEDTGALRSVRYVGWWTDEETGKLWVDGTSWYSDYSEAEWVCRARGEIAFWSIADQREFRPVVLADKEV